MSEASSPRMVRDFAVVAEGYAFIEAPRVGADGTVWFADLLGGGVHRRVPGRDAETVLPDRIWVGGMLLDESGRGVCGGRGGIVVVDPATRTAAPWLTEIEGQPIVAVNDMEGDGRGGLFGGTLDFVSVFEKGLPPEPGMLFHATARGEVTVLRRDVFASNGIATSACGRYLFHSETSRGVWRYPLQNDGMPDIAAGTLVIEVPDGDGLVVDTDGAFWLACYDVPRLLRCSPDGAILDELTLPYDHIICPAFGPGDPHGLYISTGGRKPEDRGGAVVRMEVDVAGIAGPMTRLVT
ncbi:SMP-30/gluconolactonase/LRE family protein [Croceicoccus sp. BE223]|uniref:SMP-30/gluconolactonase/LRE family protein n=1 Tax=Croceicoccus sp. BE223 TaxID=2817716 RepID=UPI002862997E|nr:SMP-30/gluconolactonase/LRE family protein [Croceicoccus sp. BE223]MDR7101971.1 sugar lactone lactonase YvrE [Croceicoccus sp. BE223]